MRSVAKGVRPTPDRVRQSLFARLGDLSGTTVLDLYAGTGVMGIEALSRGASFVAFVEKAQPAWTALRDNLALLELDERVELFKGDASRTLQRLLEAGHCFDLVLLDPPYESDELPKALAALAEGEVVAAEGTLVVEHGRRHAVPLTADWAVLDEWVYGETQVTRLGRPATAGQGGRES